MSRLIDADKLMEELKEIEADGGMGMDFITFEDLIKGQPSAFDVDKVEKELRSLKQYDNKYDSYYDHSMYMMTDFQNETVNRTIDKVLEIVRRGEVR